MNKNVLRLPEEFVVEFSTLELASDNPSQFFDGVSNVLDALQAIDANLAAFLLPDARVVFRIEQISTGSLLAKLASLIEGIPEEDLRGQDWKRVVGHFIVEGRKTIVRWLRDKSKSPKAEDVDRLAEELEALCAKAKGPTKRFSRRLLLSLVVRTIRGVQSMPAGETVAVTLGTEKIALLRQADVPPTVVEAVANAELEPFEQQMRLLVKKPDMLGKSQWELMDRGHVIRAKMGAGKWLADYQRREVVVNPGDAIDAMVRLTPKAGTGAEEYTYEITAVRGIVRSTIVQQPALFSEDAANDDGSTP